MPSPYRSSRLGPGALAAGFVLFVLLALAEPLAAYTLALALFGLPHVLSELRYADRRFSRRIAAGLRTQVLLALCGIVAIRAATVSGALAPGIGAPAELAGVAALAFRCAEGGAWRKGIAVAAGLAIGGGALAAPFETAVVLSVLHNLTPLGFFWEIAPAGRRTGIMAMASGGLVALPLLVATGLPGMALSAWGLAASGADPLGAGPLARHLYVYVPSWLAASPRAVDFFTASVVAQGAHYVSVIAVLPALLRRFDPGARGLARWPSGSAFALLCLGLGAVSLAAFAGGFGEARAAYGPAAAFHAWVELPLLILVLTGGVHSGSSNPASRDAPLAASESTMA